MQERRVSPKLKCDRPGVPLSVIPHYDHAKSLIFRDGLVCRNGEETLPLRLTTRMGSHTIGHRFETLAPRLATWISGSASKGEAAMDYEFILVEKEEGVAFLTLNRPEKLNAMNRQLNRELQDAVKTMNADDDIGCIVITGAGERAFSAGGDIHEQRVRDQEANQGAREEQDQNRSRGTYDISSSLKPVIGMINGLAYGGRGGPVLFAGHPDWMRKVQLPISRRRLRPNQLNMDSAQPGRLAHCQGVVVYRPGRGSGRGTSHWPAEPPGSGGPDEGQDHGNRDGYRQQPARIGDGY